MSGSRKGILNLIRAGVIWKSNCTCPSAKAAIGEGSPEAAGDPILQHQGRSGGAQPHGTPAHTGQKEPQDGGKPLCPAAVHSPFPSGVLHRLALTQEPRAGRALHESERRSGIGGGGKAAQHKPSLPTFAGNTGRCRQGNAKCTAVPTALHGASLSGPLGHRTDTPSPREKHSFRCTSFLRH